MSDEHELAKLLNTHRSGAGSAGRPTIISHGGWDHTDGEECAVCDLINEHLTLEGCDIQGGIDKEPGSAEAPMTHEQAMALVQALFYELEVGEDTGHHANYAFINALRVAHPDLPPNHAFWPYHTKRIVSLKAHQNRIDARKKIGAMIERWGKAIQDCVEEPKKENGHGGQEEDPAKLA